MISHVALKTIAKARLNDAQALLLAHRYDGGVYICGYAVELALKSKICKHLRWGGYPSSNGEFQDYLTFKTHKLDVLLRLSGQEMRIKAKYVTEWLKVVTWDPQVRYKSTESATRLELQIMIAAAKTLLRHI
jgi:hypothetical protein